MWKGFLVLFVIGVVGVNLQFLPLPPYLNACHKDDPNLNECGLREAKNGLPYILKGDRRYGIPNFLPMKLDIISVDTPGNFKISLKNVSIYGLEKLEVTGVKANLTEHVVNMNFSVPSYTLLSKYEMDGRILVLSLKGEGESNITATDVTVEYELKYDLVDKNGEQFVKIADQHVHYEVSRAYFNFTNLFNGDKLLGDSTINLLNDEWKSINDELKEGIEETIKSVSATIVGGIFEKVPYRFAFL